MRVRYKEVEEEVSVSVWQRGHIWQCSTSGGRRLIVYGMR